MRSRSLLLAAVAALAGCSLTLKTDELDPLQSAEGFCETFSSKSVDWFNRCFGISGAVDGALYDDLTSGSCASLEASVSSGALAYDAGAAAACISSLDSMWCNTYEFFTTCPLAERLGRIAPGACTSACAGVVTGHHGENQPCSTALDCASPGTCVLPPSTCGGKCVWPARSGQTCASGTSQPCMDGLYCDYMSGTCQPLGNQGTYCVDGTPCNSALYCDLYWTTCQWKAGLNDECGVDPTYTQCASGLYCSYNYCVRYAEVNESCEYGEQCAPDLFCDTYQGNRCAAYPRTPSPVGSDCHWPRFCNPGHTYCDGSSSTCLPAKTSGYCPMGNECAVGYRCDSASGWVCVREKDEGASCFTFEDCKGGLFCSAEGRCELYPTEPGQMCGYIGIGGSYVGCGGFDDIPCDESTPPARCARLRRTGETCGGMYEQCAGTERGAQCLGGICTAPCW